MQKQSRRSQRDRDRVERLNQREYASSIRRLDQARKAEERLRLQVAKAAIADSKRLEKEAKEAYIEAKEAETEVLNAELDEIKSEIDSLLASTLNHDDYVDLQKLKQEVKHPKFSDENERPLVRPLVVPNLPPPDLVLPVPPRGLSAFFGKKKHALAVEAANRKYEADLGLWRENCNRAALARMEEARKHAELEANRLSRLAEAKARYDLECVQREQEVAARNQELDQLIANLGYGTVEAIQEYVAIVLSNSVYPEQFPVSHDFQFDPSTAELELKVKIPAPVKVTSIKSYKYNKANDEIVSTQLPQKDCRDRYTNAVHQVALRSFHEVFEADRRGLIHTVALQVGTESNDPSTGEFGFIPLVVAAAERNSFLELKLANVVPSMALAKIGASISKNPFALAQATTTGIRRS
jgi:restriction system protein